MAPRLIRSLMIGGAIALVYLPTPSVAAAAVTIDSYKITSNMPAYPAVPSDGPSTFQAGANPDAGSWSVFSYPNSSEDVNTAITNFSPGLLGNPVAVPACAQAALEAGGTACPARSAIGTLSVKTTGFPGCAGSRRRIASRAFAPSKTSIRACAGWLIEPVKTRPPSALTRS